MMREFLVNLDRVSKYLKYLKIFEKQSKLPKNSDFFARGDSQIKIDRKLISLLSLQSTIGVHY